MHGKARGVGHLDISRLPKADLVEEIERYVGCNIVNLTRQPPFCGMASRAERFADHVEGVL